MANINGWAKWLAGILWVIIFTILTTTITNVIANDRDSRARDLELERRLDKSVVKQVEINGQILATLREIQTEQKYIMRAIDGKNNS